MAVALITCLFMACDESRIFEQNADIHEKTWNVDSIKSFSFKIENPGRSYDLYYNFRNTRAYPYRNLYVQYTLEDSLGNKLDSGLHNINLFDPKTGEPFGSGLGDIYDHQVLALEDYIFKNPGWYRFKIQQYMRIDNLPEITSVGLRVENNGQ